MDQANTINFELNRSQELHASLDLVYKKKKKKGYNPIMQLVGYILSEDPTYITAHNNARKIIAKLDRDEILSELLLNYLSEKEPEAK